MITLLDVYQNGKGNPIPGAAEVLFELLRERPREANISHKELPSYAQHELFVRSKPYRAWFLVLNEYEQRVGAVSLTRNNEIGIAILKKYHRQGYALQAIEAVLKFPPLLGLPGQRNAHYVANVAPGNEASHQLFTKAGWHPIQVTYQRP